jgi:hypothetical protein
VRGAHARAGDATARTIGHDVRPPAGHPFPGSIVDDPSLSVIALVALAMFLGATVKGAIGFGLPLVALPVMAFGLPPQTAMALLAVPIVGSNILQARQRGLWRPALGRFWPLIAGGFVGLVAGLQLLARADAAELHVLIGLTIVAVGVSQLSGLRIPRPRPEREAPTSGAVGVLAGLIGGMTSMFGPPAITYLVALRLDKDLFVAALAVYYAAVSLPFFVSLALLGIIGWAEFLGSVAAMAPIAAGVATGTALRRLIPPEPFRRVVLVALVVVGLVMAGRALGDIWAA